MSADETEGADSLKHDRWNSAIIVLHWATVACIIYLVGWGWQLGAHAAHIGQRTTLLQWHASLGVALIVVLFVRLFVRLVSRRPLAPGENWLHRRSAFVVQAGLYFTMMALVLTGIVAAAPRPFAPVIHLFGVWPLPRISGLPPIVVQNIRSIHEALVWLMLAFAAAHVLAAIYGTFVRKDRTLHRMVPWLKRSGRGLR